MYKIMIFNNYETLYKQLDTLEIKKKMNINFRNEK